MGTSGGAGTLKDFFGVAEAAHFAVLYSQADNALSARLADYAFVIRSSADIEAFRDAELQAAHTGVDLLTALFTAGQISPERYTRWLAMALDIPSATYDIRIDADVAQAALEPSGQVKTPISGFWHGVPAIIVNATDAHPQTVKLRVYDAQRHGMPVVLIAGRPLLSAIERACARSNLRTATTGLKRQLPLFSASRAAPQWQPFSAILIVGLIIGAAYMMPHATLSFLIILLTVPFSGVVFIRLYALISMLRAPPAMRSRSGRGHPPGAVVVNDRDLPHYSVMVALYDEAEVLPHLVTALSRLDYPAAKLDCMLVIEELDFATKAALLNLELPTFMRVVVVPDGKPRTKPRALNYALQLAHGDYVVIYDAEDRPEPDQLRRAFAAFAAASSVNERTGELACVQACLNIFNVRQSWLTRQFTVEYSALFDGVLPALQNLNLPMPLGGTSNHFPRAVLAELYGWDPYNVTEDADLGIRLARLGYRVGVISSTTWEEAPPTFNLWLKQRTRWLKGWMQTFEPPQNNVLYININMI